jgi:hypothetical protein
MLFLEHQFKVALRVACRGAGVPREDPEGSERTTLDVKQLGDLIQARFTRTAFRLETLDAYEVASDGGDVARYLRGGKEPDPERKGAWLARLRREAAEESKRSGSMSGAAH